MSTVTTWAQVVAAGSAAAAAFASWRAVRRTEKDDSRRDLRRRYSTIGEALKKVERVMNSGPYFSGSIRRDLELARASFRALSPSQRAVLPITAEVLAEGTKLTMNGVADAIDELELAEDAVP